MRRYNLCTVHVYVYCYVLYMYTVCMCVYSATIHVYTVRVSVDVRIHKWSVWSSLQDLSELFGCDLPDETSNTVRFTWRDGPFLRAMKRGEWIMLDEASAH